MDPNGGVVDQLRGLIFNDIRERAREPGTTAFFRKPVDGQALIDAVHWAMGNAKNKSGPSGS